MKLTRKKFPKIIILILCLSFFSTAALPVYGADKREKISSVKLTVSYEEKPEVGKTIGTVTVHVSNDKLEISEPAQYYDTDDDVWIRGEIPVIRVELAVKEEAQYRFLSSTKVSTTGGRSEVKSKKILNSGNRLQVDLKLPKVTGPLEETDDYYWDGRRARWSEVEGADKYEVKLYRGSSQVTTVTTTGTSYYFYPHMNRGGEYTFRVRALNSLDGAKGSWTDKSEEFYLSSGDAYQGTASAPDNENSGPGSHPTDGQGNSQPTGWIQHQSRWSYRRSDGNLVRDSWLFADNNWFYLGNDNIMRTGWIFVDNNWFYLNPVSDGTRGAMKTGWVFADNNWFFLNPVSDGTRGAMKTGWIFADNNWFYLNPVSDGTRGAMKTGWVFADNNWYYLDPVSGGPKGVMKTGYQYINGKWYYLDDKTGMLWTNRQIPDGRWANQDGALQRTP